MRDGPQQKEEPMMQNWNLEGRRIVNWKTCDWQPYPGLERPQFTVVGTHSLREK